MEHPVVRSPENVRGREEWARYCSNIVEDVLNLVDYYRLHKKCYGPFVLYHSSDWDEYLDRDHYLSNNGVLTQTTRNRLRQIDGIEDVKRLEPDNPTCLSVRMALKPFSMFLFKGSIGRGKPST
jgi:hypothetical protein